MHSFALKNSFFSLPILSPYFSNSFWISCEADIFFMDWSIYFLLSILLPLFLESSFSEIAWNLSSKQFNCIFVGEIAFLISISLFFLPNNSFFSLSCSCLILFLSFLNELEFEDAFKKLKSHFLKFSFPPFFICLFIWCFSFSLKSYLNLKKIIQI